MKIIKKGNIVVNTMRVTCKKCKAKLEIEPADVMKEDIGFRITCYNYYYECPCCQKRNSLKRDDMSDKFFGKIK